MLVDNYFRHEVCISTGFLPLFEVDRMEIRAELWLAKTGYNIRTIEGDITEYKFLLSLITLNKQRKDIFC